MLGIAKYKAKFYDLYKFKTNLVNPYENGDEKALVKFSLENRTLYDFFNKNLEDAISNMRIISDSIFMSESPFNEIIKDGDPIPFNVSLKFGNLESSLNLDDHILVSIDLSYKRNGFICNNDNPNFFIQLDSSKLDTSQSKRLARVNILEKICDSLGELHEVASDDYIDTEKGNISINSLFGYLGDLKKTME